MSTTPNMGLTIDVPLSTPGPQWAIDIAANFQLLDVHDHTASNGVKVPVAGMNINADLDFQSNNAINLRTLRLNSLSATPVLVGDLRVIYSKNGELAYRDASGNEVVITSNGSVAGATGTITGLVSPASAAYSSVNKALTVNQDTAKPAKLNISEISIYEFDNATANPITLASAASVPNAYTVTLPDAPPVIPCVLVMHPDGHLEAPITNTRVGMVPVGGVIATFPNLTGAYVTAATTAAGSAGYVLCQGQTLVDGRSAMNGQVIPDITGGIFIEGATTSGGTGGANSYDLTHTHDMGNHTHVMSHVHQWMAGVDSGGGSGSLQGLNSVNTATTTFAAGGLPSVFISSTIAQSGAGVSGASFSGANGAWYTAGVLSSPHGSGSSATTESPSTNITSSALSVIDNRPSYINAVYLMRVL